MVLVDRGEQVCGKKNCEDMKCPGFLSPQACLSSFEAPWSHNMSNIFGVQVTTLPLREVVVAAVIVYQRIPQSHSLVSTDILLPFSVIASIVQIQSPTC